MLESTPRAVGRAITNTSTAAMCNRRARNASRTVRLMRLRSTARLLTLRDTANPNRHSLAGEAIQRKLKWVVAVRPVACCSARKSAARNRALGGSPATTRGLRDKAFAALGATRRQDLASIGRFHAGPETVGTGALEEAGLESAFHGWLRERMPA